MQSSPSEGAAGMLEGVRVVDLSRHLPGPLTTLLLADLGAEVTKVEPPAGDEMRRIGGDGDGPSPHFNAVNAGKTTCRIDLKTECGRNRLRDMVAGADVLVESFRPGVMARLGLAPETLLGDHPRLVYCALSGFGQQASPHVDRAGHDLNYLALTGMLAATSRGDAAAPATVFPPMADGNAALMGVIGIVSALFRRARTGRGGMVDVAVADAALPHFVFSLADMASGAKSPISRMLGGAAPYYSVYRASDGHVTLAAVEPKFWQRFCAAAQREDWLPRQHDAQVRPQIEAMFAHMTVAEACRRFEPADCCFAPVADGSAMTGDGHLRRRGVVRQGVDGACQGLLPILFDGQPPRLRPPLRDVDDAGAPRTVDVGDRNSAAAE